MATIFQGLLKMGAASAMVILYVLYLKALVSRPPIRHG